MSRRGRRSRTESDLDEDRAIYQQAHPRFDHYTVCYHVTVLRRANLPIHTPRSSGKRRSSGTRRSTGSTHGALSKRARTSGRRSGIQGGAVDVSSVVHHIPDSPRFHAEPGKALAECGPAADAYAMQIFREFVNKYRLEMKQEDGQIQNLSSGLLPEEVEALRKSLSDFRQRFEDEVKQIQTTKQFKPLAGGKPEPVTDAQGWRGAIDSLLSRLRSAQDGMKLQRAALFTPEAIKRRALRQRQGAKSPPAKRAWRPG